MLVKKVESLNVPFVVYTYAGDCVRRVADKAFLREGYPYRYIKERKFDLSRTDITKDDIILTADWTKDFFHNSYLPCAVFHIHPSKLPLYRGYGAISAQFLSGVAVGGVSVYLENGFVDAGDIVFSRDVRIAQDDYPLDYLDNCVNALDAFWDNLYGQELSPQSQNEEEAFYVQRKRRKMGYIDFNMSAIYVYNTVRAYSEPFFGSYFFVNNTQVKIWKAKLEKWTGHYGTPGSVVSKDSYGVEIACGDGTIILSEVECDNKKYLFDEIHSIFNLS